MRYLRWMLFFLGVVCFIVLLTSNYNADQLIQDGKISVRFWNFTLLRDYHPMTALLIAFFAGALCMGIWTLYHYIRHNITLNTKEKIIKNLKAELNSLRNVSLGPSQQFSGETMIFSKDANEGSALFQKDEKEK